MTSVTKQEPMGFQAAGFRTKLLAAMMIVVAAISLAVLYVAERQLVAGVEGDLEKEFQSQIANWQNVQEIRQAALVERVRALVLKPRLLALLDADTFDFLYSTTTADMRDLMVSPTETGSSGIPGFHADFYRFLDRQGKVITTGVFQSAGRLRPEEEERLTLPSAPRERQIGYLVRIAPDGAESLAEVIAMPVLALDAKEVIATIVLGFDTRPLAPRPESGIIQSLLRNGRLYSQAIPAETRATLAADVTAAIAAGQAKGSSLRINVAGVPHLLFYKHLNPGSLYTPAYEVSIYPLTSLREQQKRLRWQVAGAGALLLMGAFGASHFLSGRLAMPVVQLADASAKDRAHLVRAEVELEQSKEELQRASRFSADASHQLKTPVAVMRAGLEEIMHSESLTAQESERVSNMIHQTYRLSGIIEDLLLLSRIDAGRLALALGPFNLTGLVEAALDDVGAAPGAKDLEVETNLSADLRVLGERRYIALVLQNLFENAWKYNRIGGGIRVSARMDGDWVDLTVANTGSPIPPSVQVRLFERFQRGNSGDSVPGYGIGLNLAQELVRLHGGRLRLARSDAEWTEFELRLRRAPA